MNTFTLQRDGRFSVDVFGDFHCGTKYKHSDRITIQYSLTCVCEDDLDHRGFLFDQLKIEQYFNQIVKTSLSCELLTKIAVQDLISVIKKDNRHCRIKEMCLTLSPEPYMASVSYAMTPPAHFLAEDFYQQE